MPNTDLQNNQYNNHNQITIIQIHCISQLVGGIVSIIQNSSQINHSDMLTIFQFSPFVSHGTPELEYKRII